MKPILAFAVAVTLAASSAYAATQTGGTTPAKSATNTQNERMKVCNERATGKKGDDRKTFMSSCLAGNDDAKLNAQQQRMKDCNMRATGKVGDDRKKFMSECLKG